MKRLIVAAFCLALISITSAQDHRPKEGFVPDQKTAVKIAEAVLMPVYGEQQVLSERPFHAALKDDVWTVDGTLHCKDEEGKETEDCFGGAAQVKISKIDGRILSMIHYK